VLSASLSQKQWEQRMMSRLSQVPDGQMNFSEGGGGRDVQLYLTGDDAALLDRTGHQVLAQMRGLGEIHDPASRAICPGRKSWCAHGSTSPPNSASMCKASARTIRIATLGDLPQNGAKFSLSDRQIPIRVSLIESARRDLSTLESLPVPTVSGASVPLKTVADVSFGEGPSAVRRYNQSRRLFFQADLNTGVELGTATKKSTRSRR